jgi:hypothetical protein
MNQNWSAALALNLKKVKEVAAGGMEWWIGGGQTIRIGCGRFLGEAVAPCGHEGRQELSIAGVMW